MSSTTPEKAAENAALVAEMARQLRRLAAERPGDAVQLHSMAQAIDVAGVRERPADDNAGKTATSEPMPEGAEAVLDRVATSVAELSRGDRRVLGIAADFFAAARKLGRKPLGIQPTTSPQVQADGVFTAGRRPERAIAGPPSFALSQPTIPGETWYSVVEGKQIAQAALSQLGCCCAYCGLQSDKYHLVLARDGRDWDVDSMQPTCIFCALPMTLDQVDQLDAGLLIWAPEFSQRDISVIAQALYVVRLSQGPNAAVARLAIDQFRARAEAARAHFGSDQPRMLVRALAASTTLQQLQALRASMSGLRLFPLDRRNIREGDLRFNQFPQILAYWRSKQGPFAGGAADLDVSALKNVVEGGTGPVAAWPG